MSEEKLMDKIKANLEGHFLTEDQVKLMIDATKISDKGAGNVDLSSGKYSIPQLLDHLSTCNNDSCAVHKAKVDQETKAWLRGLNYGIKIGGVFGKTKQ